MSSEWVIVPIMMRSPPCSSHSPAYDNCDPTSHHLSHQPPKLTNKPSKWNITFLFWLSSSSSQSTVQTVSGSPPSPTPDWQRQKTSHFILHLNAKRQINIWRSVASAAMRVCFIWWVSQSEFDEWVRGVKTHKGGHQPICAWKCGISGMDGRTHNFKFDWLSVWHTWMNVWMDEEEDKGCGEGVFTQNFIGKEFRN